MSLETVDPLTPHTMESPVILSELDRTLETQDIGLDQDAHSRLDNFVLRTFYKEPTDTTFLLPYLLVTIVAKSDGLLHEKYMDPESAGGLLHEYPEMSKLLHKAWSEKSFRSIRDLKILRANQASGGVALGVPMEQKDAVIQAFNLEYRGDAHKVLLQAVDEMYRMGAEQHYAKIVPITQSSGMGKSKTVDKVATERILIPLCLREDIGNNYFAYPPPDDAVRNYLMGAPSTVEEKSCKAYLRSFFCSLFTMAYAQAKTLFLASKNVSYANMVKTFYDFFKDTPKRNAFYKTVIENISSLSVEVSKPFWMFHNYLKERCSDWPVACPIIMSMDEVHVLFEIRSKDAGSTYDLFSRMKSVLSEAVSTPLCIIFLSTATNVPNLAPSKDVAPSMRERDDELLQPAPFTELPFDVYIIAEPLTPEQERLTSVGWLEFTAKFGRPLFYATYLSRKSQDESQDSIVRGMMLIVREKLCGRRWPPDQPAVLDLSSIAVLSARLLLDLSPASSMCQKYEQGLVRGHLRNIFSVRKDRLSLVSGYPPEPLVAEAAAQIMNHRIKIDNVEEAYMNVWELLARYIDEGLAPQGTIGELIGRVLSISAMDNAINSLSESAHSELKFQPPVLVTDYYKSFLSNGAWETLRKSVPANHVKLSEESANKTFEEAFDGAYFHFSHYGRANDATPIHDKFAWALWLRGTAVLCQLNQELTDRAYPIFFSKLSTVSPKSVSMAFNQDKASEYITPNQVGIQSAEALKLFSQGNRHPYIAAVHCYALTQKEGIFVTTIPPYDLRHPLCDEEAPRYQVDFWGLESYRNLTEATKSRIRTMINGSKNALFNQHPRAYGKDLVRQMLPVLERDASGMAWYKTQAASTGKGKAKEVLAEQDPGPSHEPASMVLSSYDGTQVKGKRKAKDFLEGKNFGSSKVHSVFKRFTGTLSRKNKTLQAEDSPRRSQRLKRE